MTLQTYFVLFQAYQRTNCIGSFKHFTGFLLVEPLRNALLPFCCGFRWFCKLASCQQLNFIVMFAESESAIG